MPRSTGRVSGGLVVLLVLMLPGAGARADLAVGPVQTSTNGDIASVWAADLSSQRITLRTHTAYQAGPEGLPYGISAGGASASITVNATIQGPGYIYFWAVGWADNWFDSPSYWMGMSYSNSASGQVGTNFPDWHSCFHFELHCWWSGTGGQMLAWVTDGYWVEDPFSLIVSVSSSCGGVGLPDATHSGYHGAYSLAYGGAVFSTHVLDPSEVVPDPLPEPGSLSLLALGGLGVIRRMRK